MRQKLYFLCLETILLNWILKYSGVAKRLASCLWQVQIQNVEIDPDIATF